MPKGSIGGSLAKALLDKIQDKGTLPINKHSVLHKLSEEITKNRMAAAVNATVSSMKAKKDRFENHKNANGDTYTLPVTDLSRRIVAAHNEPLEVEKTHSLTKDAWKRLRGMKPAATAPGCLLACLR